VHARQSDAADAGWQELLAESWDRGVESPDSDTVRTAARRLAVEHKLDDQGRAGLRTVVGVVERSWYGGGATADSTLAPALDQVRDSMRRNAPLGWKARLLPRPVLHPPRLKRAPAED